jgi:hypothetical protein
VDDPAGAGPRSRAARLWWLRCHWLPSGDVWRIEPTGISWLSVGSIGCRGTVVFTDTNFVEPVVVHQSTRSRQVTADQGQRSRAAEPLMDFPEQASMNGQRPGRPLSDASCRRNSPTTAQVPSASPVSAASSARSVATTPAGSVPGGTGSVITTTLPPAGPGSTRRYAPAIRPGATSRR